MTELNVIPYELNLKQSNSIKHLIKCFDELINKKSIDEISVKSLCEEACISRSNFYNNFEDKYHFIFFYLSLKATKANSEDILKYLERNKLFFCSLVNSKNIEYFGSVIERIVENRIKEQLSWDLNNENQKNNSWMFSQVTFLSLAIYKTITWWLTSDTLLAPSDILYIINNYFTSSIALICEKIS